MFVLNAIWNQLNSKSMIRFKLFFLHSVIRMVNCAEQYIMDVIPPWLRKAGNIFLGKSNFLIFYRKIVEILLHLSFRNNKLFNNCVSREWKVLTTVLVHVPTKKTLAATFFSIAVFLVLKIINKYVFAKFHYGTVLQEQHSIANPHAQVDCFNGVWGPNFLCLLGHF